MSQLPYSRPGRGESTREEANNPTTAAWPLGDCTKRKGTNPVLLEVLSPFNKDLQETVIAAKGANESGK